MSWSEFWWLMRNDAETRRDFIVNVLPPFAVLIALLAFMLIAGPV